MATTAFGLPNHRGAARGALGTTYFGTETYDPADPATCFEERRKRCYELATAALIFGTAPEGSLLVFGSMDGHRPGGPGRIGHAWLWLPGGGAWEPITGDVYASREAWLAYADARVERVYTRREAQRMASEHETYGPWEPTEYR